MTQRHASGQANMSSTALTLNRVGGLFNLVRGLPDSPRYEHGLILAEGDCVIVHGRFSGDGRPAALIAADIVRTKNGRLAEHWDGLRDEATQAEQRVGRRCSAASFSRNCRASGQLGEGHR
jgi:hypothetical protein